MLVHLTEEKLLFAYLSRAQILQVELLPIQKKHHMEEITNVTKNEFTCGFHGKS